jgi:GcrA cell cycle regulator
MGGHVNSIWTDEQAEALTSLLADGQSYAEIAAALNEQFNTNYSRNAACGKGFRLGLAAPQKVKAPPRERKRKPAETTIKPLPRMEEIQLRCAEIEPRHLTLDQLEPNDCRYPYGDGPFTFCGLLNTDGSSYCPEHFRLSTTYTRPSSDAVSQARARHMRRVNFRKGLLEGAQ